MEYSVPFHSKGLVLRRKQMGGKEWEEREKVGTGLCQLKGAGHYPACKMCPAHRDSLVCEEAARKEAAEGGEGGESRGANVTHPVLAGVRRPGGLARLRIKNNNCAALADFLGHKQRLLNAACFFAGTLVGVPCNTHHGAEACLRFARLRVQHAKQRFLFARC